MAGFLRPTLGRLGLLAALILVAVTASTAARAYAGSATGDFTGYAMGNQYGLSGEEIGYTDFANHPWYATNCPDPAKNWPWGTRIDTPQWVLMHVPPYYTVYYSTFYLYDGGDPECDDEGPYWVDLYFGRAKWTGQPCVCPGVPSPGYCVDAPMNNCDDAIAFGRWRWTYTYTFP